MSGKDESTEALRVFKFGGASVKDATGLRNVAQIIATEALIPARIVVVVSAMGKTTNALEAILAAQDNGLNASQLLDELFDTYRLEAKAALQNSERLLARLKSLQSDAALQITKRHSTSFDESYDSFVSIGELVSSELLTTVLREHVPSADLLDARELIKTDSTFRAPQVDTDASFKLIRQAIESSSAQILVVPGFIGSDEKSRTTTLGREGSDYTAALFGAALQAASVTVWKDVPGVLNADPKRLPSARLLPRMTYADAAEMTFYGATVLHPKTLKPLAEQGIPLYVRSFLRPTEPGTYIGPDARPAEAKNVLLHLDKVALIRCQTRDLSFVTELHVSRVLQSAHQVGLRVLMLQSSALELYIAVPEDFLRAGRLADILQAEYQVSAQYDLALSTFLNAEAPFVEDNLQGRHILVRQQNAGALWVLTRA